MRSAASASIAVKAVGVVRGQDVSQSDTKFGLNVGAGLSFNLSGFETFVETRFHSVFTEAAT